MSPAQFFASRLHMSMTGLGTNDSRLIRVTVMRCEIDLADVDINFGFNYGKTLNSYIKVIWFTLYIGKLKITFNCAGRHVR